MSSTRLASLLGLGFGDCGKGLFTDYLCRNWDTHTVVRFNGGAQAGHNVVLPDGRHHIFSQFCSGSFVPGVVTVLAYPVIVHPTALLVEAARLQRLGVSDCLQRMLIDERCRITTPFHQAAGRLRELARGQSAHGSCGVGVGETVQHSLERPEHILRYADLLQPQAALAKLEVIRHQLLSEFVTACVVPENSALYDAELRMLSDEAISARWLEHVAVLSAKVRPATKSMIADRLHRPGAVLFEGAQGVLLDEWHGFHPHTTWSSISSDAVEAVTADYGLSTPIRHFGLIRSYLTRHGAGPMPTWDAELDCLNEPHNDSSGWQGRFRRGHPDAVLLRYARSAAGKLDGIFVSHLDAFSKTDKLTWCVGYESDLAVQDDAICTFDARDGLIIRLHPTTDRNLEHQRQLTQLLSRARPRFETTPMIDAQSHIQKIEEIANCPVFLGSYGPQFDAVAMQRKRIY
ncbi:MAG: adenylosuccinate synthetase [Burkholderiales bacterium]|nr:adenylosuccinate synthetase [Burkholderiales bacterium]